MSEEERRLQEEEHLFGDSMIYEEIDLDPIVTLNVPATPVAPTNNDWLSVLERESGEERESQADRGVKVVEASIESTLADLFDLGDKIVF